MNTQHTKVGFRFGEWLIAKGRISPRELSEALNQQKITGERLGVVLQKLDMLSEEESLAALAMR